MQWNFLRESDLDKKLLRNSQNFKEKRDRAQSQQEFQQKSPKYLQEYYESEQFEDISPSSKLSSMKQLNQIQPREFNENLIEIEAHIQEAMKITEQTYPLAESPTFLLKRKKQKDMDKGNDNREVNFQQVNKQRVCESSIPLEALYNPQMESLKQFEYFNQINPQPINMQIYHGYDGNKEHSMIRYTNDELGVILDHMYTESQVKHFYQTFQEDAKSRRLNVNAKKDGYLSSLFLMKVDRLQNNGGGAGSLERRLLLNGNNYQFNRKATNLYDDSIKQLHESTQTQINQQKAGKKLPNQKKIKNSKSRYSKRIDESMDECDSSDISISLSDSDVEILDEKKDARFVEIVKEYMQLTSQKFTKDDNNLTKAGRDDRIKQEIQLKHQLKVIKPNMHYLITRDKKFDKPKSTQLSPLRENDVNQQRGYLIRDTDQLVRVLAKKSYGKYYLNGNQNNQNLIKNAEEQNYEILKIDMNQHQNETIKFLKKAEELKQEKTDLKRMNNIKDQVKMQLHRKLSLIVADKQVKNKQIIKEDNKNFIQIAEHIKKAELEQKRLYHPISKHMNQSVAVSPRIKRHEDETGGFSTFRHQSLLNRISVNNPISLNKNLENSLMKQRYDDSITNLKTSKQIKQTNNFSSALLNQNHSTHKQVSVQNQYQSQPKISMKNSIFGIKNQDNLNKLSYPHIPNIAHENQPKKYKYMISEMSAFDKSLLSNLIKQVDAEIELSQEQRENIKQKNMLFADNLKNLIKE
eukprot:403372572